MREPPSDQLPGFITREGWRRYRAYGAQDTTPGCTYSPYCLFTRLAAASFPAYASWFSAGRRQRYRVAGGGDEAATVRLYQANLRLAQALYGPLHTVEVALRNALDEHLRWHFDNDAHWLITQKSGFMQHPTLPYRDPVTGQARVRDRLRRSVEEAQRNLPPTSSPGKLVAELTFGFWTSLYDREHFRILQGQPLRVFRAAPPALKRQDVANHLRLIRGIRNRVYHYEPLCFAGDGISLADTLAAHQAIHDVCGWLGPDLLLLLQPLDQVPTAVQSIRGAFPGA